MKRLLMALLVLGVSLPAVADVFIYTSKQAETEMQSNSGMWAQSRATYTDYMVIETQSDGTVDVCSVMTYKAKDPNGKTKNYYTTQNVGALDFTQVQIGKKQTWIISGTNLESRMMLSGAMQPARRAPGDHGNGPHCSQCHSGRPDRIAIPANAAVLTGVSIWDQNTGIERAVGAAKITMKLNIKMTEAAMQGGFGPDETVNYIVGILRAKGYIQGM